MVSLIVNGKQLIPNPVRNLTSIRVLEVHSDEADSGQSVGGATLPPVCSVPLPRSANAMLAMGLLATGLWISRRTTLRRQAYRMR